MYLDALIISSLKYDTNLTTPSCCSASVSSLISLSYSSFLISLCILLICSIFLLVYLLTVFTLSFKPLTKFAYSSVNFARASLLIGLFETVVEVVVVIELVTGVALFLLGVLTTPSAYKNGLENASSAKSDDIFLPFISQPNHDNLKSDGSNDISPGTISNFLYTSTFHPRF